MPTTYRWIAALKVAVLGLASQVQALAETMPVGATVAMPTWEDTPELDALIHAVNRHPTMYDLYTEFLETWRRDFGGTFVLYASIEPNTRYGAWGMKESWDQDLESAHKWRAALDFMATIRGTAAEPTQAPAEAPPGVSAYPNPASGTASIAFELREPGHVRLAVFDLLGREVAVLVDGPLGPGTHTARWDAAGMPDGLYLTRLQRGEAVQTGRLLLIR